MRVLVWSVVGSLLVCCLLMSGTSTSAPNPIPLATIDLGSEAYMAPTLPYCVTTVIVHGNLTVEKSCGIGRVTATLTANSPDGFIVEVIPRVIPFINPQTQRFSVHVTIPPGTPLGKSVLFVRSTVKSPGMAPSMTEAMCTINVEGHRLGALEMLEPMYRITDEDTVEMDIRVWNHGTMEDVFSLFVHTRDAPIIRYEAPTELSVPPRGSVNVTILLHMERGWLEQGAWKIGVRMDPAHDAHDMANITDHHRRTSSQEALIIEHDWTVIALSKGVDDLTPTILIAIVLLTIILIATRIWHPQERQTPDRSDGREPEYRTIEVGWEEDGYLDEEGNK